MTGTDLLTRRTMALAGRSLALRGEAVFLIRDGLIPAADRDMRTRYGRPRAYRLSIPDAGLLRALEAALAEVFESAPLGSMIVPFPEAPLTDLEGLARDFRGARGKVLIRGSVNVTAAGGPAPAQDWRRNPLSPDIERPILPALVNPGVTGSAVRKAQRHLAIRVLQPRAETMAEEATTKLGTAVRIETLRPLQAWAAGVRTRALATIVQALAQAKEAGVAPETARNRVEWEDDA